MKISQPRKEREESRKRGNKAAILKAAEQVFSEKGYTLAKVDDIALKAQFSKVTIYRYFSGKSEIFMQIIYQSLDEFLLKSQAIRRRPATAEDRLREYILFVMKYYVSKENIIRIFFFEKMQLMKIFSLDLHNCSAPVPRHPRLPDELMAKLEGLFNVICDLIRDGIESGEFRPVNVRDAAFSFGALIRGFHFHGPIGSRQYTIDESIDLIMDFFLNGIKNSNHSGKGDMS